MRELFMEGMDHPATVVCYTLPEAARALGRSELTLKRWIEDDLIPEPVLRDTTRAYRHYSSGELQAIARVLAQHEREFTYYASTHTVTRERMMQTLHAYRATHI